MSRKQTSPQEEGAGTHSQQIADLQSKIYKYEREALIEVSLECVRRQAMGMRSSDDLVGITKIVFEELEKLNLTIQRSGIGVFDPETRDCNLWTTVINQAGEQELSTGITSLTIHPMLNKTFECWESQESLSYILEGEELRDYYGLVSRGDFYLADDVIDNSKSLTKEYYYYTPFVGGGLYFFSDTEPLDVDKQILTRFAEVFNLTYTRFLDLQKAEAQAREAQIEAALERVRAAGMAMHQSSDLIDATNVLFEQISALGIEAVSGFITIVDADDDSMTIYLRHRDLMGHPTKVYGGDHENFRKEIDSWKAGDNFVKIRNPKKDFIKSVKKIFGTKVKSRRDKDYFHLLQMYHKFGFLGLGMWDEAKEEHYEIYKRCAQVFEQTYTRYIDIQKAEAQVREAQIEAALERVRAAGMAMHQTAELQGVVNVVNAQLLDLGLELDGTLISIRSDNQDDTFNAWVNSKVNAAKYSSLAYYDDIIHTSLFDFVKNGTGLLVENHEVDRVQKWYRFIFSNQQDDAVPKAVQNDIINSISNYVRSSWASPLATLTMLRVKGTDFTDADHSILERFAKVFNQAYTRFLDIQKAEAQAKEAQIEAALERVRSASMAMHESEELPNVLSVMLNEFEYFNRSEDFRDIEIFIIEEESGDATAWASDQNFQNAVTSYPFSFHVTPGAKKDFRKWKQTPIQDRKELFIDSFYEGKSWERVLVDFDKVEALREIASTFRDNKITQWATHHACFSHGMVALQQPTKLADEDVAILQRFAKVFEQTYTRFLDLQNAEAQAKEAEIETALERVRAAGMAMHQSSELQNVVLVMYDQMEIIGLAKWGCSIILCHEETKQFENWLAAEADSGMNKNYFVKATEHPIYRSIWNKWKDQSPPFTLHHTDDYKREFDEYWLNETDFIQLPEVVKSSVLDRREVFLHYATMRFGLLNATTYESLSDGLLTTLGRFAKVFEQTYTRFLDLQKAEAQAREAQIEVALERVRAASMAMHKSEDLHKVVGTLYKQMHSFDAVDWMTNITIFNENTNTIECWLAGNNWGELLQSYNIKGEYGHPHITEVWSKWRKQTPPFHISSRGKEYKAYAHYLVEDTGFSLLPERLKKGILAQEKLQLTYINMKYGQFEIVNSDAPLSEEDIQIVVRFAKVFEQTYTRFLDLQKAEAQAREAQIEAALERVRARAMAMHNSDELSEAAELLYSEFKKLGIIPYSCGYVINNDQINRWQVWMTDANDDSFKTVWTLPYDADKHLKERYDSWKRKEVFHATVLEGKENETHHRRIAEFAPQKEGALGSLPNKLVLSSAHFEQGHLLIVTPDELEDEIQHILIRFAKVFEQTYTRFLDLKTAEEQARLIKEERDRLNIALDNLKATQSQLVQAEKMASLGELTAGIAHEIQNPLNFVNNFSDVSGEMIDEVVEELKSAGESASGGQGAHEENEIIFKKENLEEVKDILSDLKGNLEKISHHGNRASSIVKGMLDHSRTSSDEKVPTDINALCDEYLRLSYHGLRAKDKSFNCAYETDFDDSLPLIDVVPQDIGRVLLNILNNAFYAVSARAKAHAQPLTPEGNPARLDYQPMVTITTKQLSTAEALAKEVNNLPAGHAGSTTISIKDNGIGMSEETIDKVFQPFFTTKPTGQGTGLGMSISYDIITKGHGGKLTVESEEGVGTTFLIILLFKHS